MKNFCELLAGGDIRSTGNVAKVIHAIKTKEDFDELMSCLENTNRIIAMRAADAIEKITRKNSEWLHPYSSRIFSLSTKDQPKEFKWHLAQLLPRFQHSKKEAETCWHILRHWAHDKNNSRIVRVCSLQSLFELLVFLPENKSQFFNIMNEMESENIPSFSSRIRKILSLGIL